MTNNDPMPDSHSDPSARAANIFSRLDLLSSGDRELVDVLRSDVADGTPEEQAYVENEVYELLSELAVTEAINAQVNEDIARAKALAAGRLSANAELDKTQTTTKIDGSRIGWLTSDEEFEVPIERVEAGERSYWLASIIDKNSTTNSAFESLEKQGVSQELFRSVRDKSIPIFVEGIKSGKHALTGSPKSKSGLKRPNAKRSMKTDYPAYKVGVQGTNNRAIILITGAVDGEMIIVVAALYDHDDQHKITHSLFSGKISKN